MLKLCLFSINRNSKSKTSPLYTTVDDNFQIQPLKCSEKISRSFEATC